MNDNISFAKYVLSHEAASPYDLSLRMKDYIHLSLGAVYPFEAFLKMKTGEE
jgi:hypothetical protein